MYEKIENLEWCMRIQNINHSKTNGRYKGKYDNLIKENLELKNKIKELEANCYKVGE